MGKKTIYRLAECTPSDHIGNKARSILFLKKSGFTVPETYICVWDAYRQYLSRPAHPADHITAELKTIIDPHKEYAVRSSSNLEDGTRCTFAGLFTSRLQVRGLASVVQAIQEVWETASSSRVRSYMEKMETGEPHIFMAVIIQEMVPPQWSGIAFTRNPLTGSNETVIEALEGTGDALASKGATPFRWIVRGGTLIRPPKQVQLPDGIIQKIARHAEKIARRYTKPVDLEWCYDGRSVYWLQLREITALETVDVYTNMFSKEFLPGIIKPLVWSINIPLVNGAWKELITEFIGPNDIDVSRLAKAFYYRAYFNTGVLGSLCEKLGFPYECLHTLAIGSDDASRKISYRPGPGSLRYIFRIILFVLDKTRFSSRVRRFLPVMWEKIKNYTTHDLPALSETQLLERVDYLLSLTKKTCYFYLVTPLIMFSYTYVLRRLLRRSKLDLKSIDLTKDMEELQEFEPTHHLTKLHEQFAALDPGLRKKVKASAYDDFLRLDGIEDFRGNVVDFIKRFGHLSDSGNDFSKTPWRESPTLILEMIIHYNRASGHTAESPGQVLRHLSPLSRRLIQVCINRVKKYRTYKEEVNSLYTYGYSMFHDLFLELGRRFARRGYLENSDDIFYLYFDEIKAAVAGDRHENGPQQDVDMRKREIMEYRDIELPGIIYGDQQPPGTRASNGSLSGIGASRGYYQGKVKVVRGIRDFKKISIGDVLVIPYSDIGLTPLFAKAGAVIAESGGILSHSSIIAREYNIPAVISVDGACSLDDNTLVTVNGYRGEVIVHDRAAGG